MQYFIGIDIGTTHCKAVAMQADGAILQQLQQGYPTIQNLPGQSEQDPEVVLNTTFLLLGKILSASGKWGKLKAICFSSAMHGMMAIGKEDRPLTNIFTWADLRSRQFAKELLNNGKAQALYERTGVPVHPMSPLCKLMWMRHEMPEVFYSAKKFISVKEYIFSRLFGKYLIDHSIASATGLFDIFKKDWNEEALKMAEIARDQLSDQVEITWVEEWKNGKMKELKGVSHLLEGVPFVIGGSDGCMANIGSGAMQKGEAAITIGTSGAIRMISHKPNPDPQQRLFNYIIEDDLFVTGGPINNGGIVLKWFAENFLQRSFGSAEDFKWLFRMIDEVPPGSDGLIFLPYLLGERAPHWDADARGAFVGLTLAHGKEHLSRAVVEGISFALYDVMKTVEETNGPIDKMYATGGFIQSSSWLQLLSDVLDKKIIVSGTADASAIGAIITGMKATGMITNWLQAKQLIPQGEVFEPDLSKHALYNQSFNEYRALYPALKNILARSS